MKNIIKTEAISRIAGIIALVAVIVFSFAACVSPPPPTPAPAPQAEPAPEPPPPPPPPPPAVVQDVARTTLIMEGARNYTVKEGDTLVEIAKQFYNNGYYYPIIFLANVGKTQDADKIEPGMQFLIPDLQRNLNDAGARGVVKLTLMGSVPFENSRHREKTANGMRDLSNSL
jgi:hypothetical protein